MAEGVETALSLRETVIKGEIKSSVGLSNIKNLEPKDPSTHVIICGDHDAPGSAAVKALEKSVHALQEKGFNVAVIKPDKLGENFNEVLKIKGPGGIREILEKRLPKDLLVSILTSAEKQTQRDFHAVKDIEKKEIKQCLKNEKENSEFILKGKSFKEIITYCEKRLHDSLARDNKPLTKERVQRFPLQAEKTATFLIHAYEHSGRNPTQEEIAQFSLRAKYELNRISELRKEIIKE
ncbi:MAG: toprim domain-containing protein [Ignavibacteria bacterium]|nr:toprim domain-containing protein [Ignavibacteria bacterium]